MVRKLEISEPLKSFKVPSFDQITTKIVAHCIWNSVMPKPQPSKVVTQVEEQTTSLNWAIGILRVFHCSSMRFCSPNRRPRTNKQKLIQPIPSGNLTYE
jgi:hypothetical protein